MLIASFRLVVSAQDAVTLLQKDGQQISFAFEEKPVITFSDNNLVITTASITLEYGIADIQKFFFSDSQTAVENVKITPVLELDAYTVRIAGAKAGATVSLFGPDGKTLNSYKTDSEGSVSFSIAELPQGLYIISSDNLTCKILKK